MNRLLILPVLLLTLLVGTPAFSADFRKGYTAYQSGDYATALREWTPLAEQGDAKSQHNLGVMYDDGTGVPQDDKTAVKWYRLAAKQGFATAQSNLGTMYETGKGVPQDDETAVKWYKLAAEQGLVEAQYNLGGMYDYGRGVPQDDETAVKWYKLAAKQGDANAQKAVRDLEKKIASEKATPPVIADRQGLPECPANQDERYDNCFGTYTYADGNKYVGEWKDDKFNGQGTYTYANGDKYVGEFRDDNLNGQGTYTYANGDKYIGEFRNGDSHGRGIEYHADGTVGEEGIWKDGEFQYAQKVAPPVVAEKPPETTPEPIQQEAAPAAKPDINLAGTGTGFSITRSGHMLTNHHVIKGCQLVVLHIEGSVKKTTVLARDKTNDLALLKANFTPKAVFSIKQKNAALMEEIMVAGYPFGRSVSSSVKITRGIVSSLTGVGDNYSNMQIDAAIQPGNSGGPIIDENGNVVGVAVARLNKMLFMKERGTIPENSNFGIKSSIAYNFAEANGIELPGEKRAKMSRRDMGKLVTKGTHYLSCWMTKQQLAKAQNKKELAMDIDPTLLRTIRGFADLRN